MARQPLQQMILAAQAANIEHIVDQGIIKVRSSLDADEWSVWNPLLTEDDAAKLAYRMAVRVISPMADAVFAEVGRLYDMSKPYGSYFLSLAEVDGDFAVGRRQAIVGALAEYHRCQTYMASISASLSCK